MGNVLFVSEAKMKAFTDINENVSVDVLLPNIQLAQDIGLQNILGSKLYKSLQEKVKTSSLNSEETELLEEKIQPYLLHRAYWEALPSLFFKIMNKSIIVGNTEQGSSADFAQLKYLRNIQQNRYEFYEQRLIDYLQYNSNKFPDYISNTKEDGMNPSKENYFSGIHISPGLRKIPNPIYLRNIPGNFENNGDCINC